MNELSPEDIDLAQRLLDRESGTTECPPLPEAAEQVAKKISERFALLFGAGGVEAVWNRAVSRSRAAYPFLASVRVQKDPAEPLNGLADSMRGVDPQKAAAALRSLIAEFLSLVFSLVGRQLVMGQLTHVWPDLQSPFRTDYTNGETR